LTISHMAWCSTRPLGTRASPITLCHSDLRSAAAIVCICLFTTSKHCLIHNGLAWAGGICWRNEGIN
jgi:hypothetical protein